ncbi:MAG: hypothetical protein IPI66_12800 [Chitinophagaceae bacterium]|nr:hypothetical protein [Chitinophagaceae bacterium]
MRWLISCLIFLSCYNASRPDHNDLVITPQDSIAEARKMERAFLEIAETKKLVSTGDLIVRTGNDFTSESLRSLNRRSGTSPIAVSPASRTTASLFTTPYGRGMEPRPEDPA